MAKGCSPRRIASATGAKLLAPTYYSLQRGADCRVDRVQYVLEPGVEQFKEFRQLFWWAHRLRWRIRVSGKEQCFHFAGMCDPHVGEAWRRLRCALDALAAALSVRGEDRTVEQAAADDASGEITLPDWRRRWSSAAENCIVVDESMTSGRD